MTLRDELIAAGYITPEPADGPPRLTERRRTAPAPAPRPTTAPSPPVERVSEPEQPDVLDGFPAFTRAVRSRLDAGREAYGDRSFSADPSVLVAELLQEALDLAGWGFVLFRRLESMRAALSGIASSSDPAPTIVAPKQEPQAPARGTRSTAEQPAPESFAVSFTPDELVILGALAVKLGMPPGDVLRFAVRRLWTEAGRQSKTSPPAPAGRLVGAERGSE